MPQLSGDAPILATKLFVPPPRDHVVTRARLRDRLAATRGGRVTLIAAAAGSGKSTLLADWALEASGRVAWLSLDSSDDDPRRFLGYVIAALRTAGGIAADEVLDAISSKPEAIQAAATELLNAVAARGVPLALVLDDYHAIESRPVHDALQFIIDHLPPNLHLVIATRADPPLALSRLRARGQLVELRGHDLRFTVDEASAFLNTAMGLALEPEEIHDLEQRTEGWAVGLQMAAISLNGRDGAHAFIQRFSGSNRYVLDYLTDEVLDRQPQSVRDFLLATSILTRLSPPLCDAVMLRSDSEAVLQQLDAANLFLIPLDDVRYWYRYHHLFATLLQHQLTRTSSADAIAALHHRAAVWYEANRMPEAAFDHALAANDVEHAVAIVSVQSLLRMFGGDTSSVVRWFDRLPQPRVENDVELLLRRGMALLGDWQLPRAYECSLTASALLGDDATSPRFGAVLGLRGALERVLGMPEEGTANLNRAAALVDEQSFWFCLVHYFFGLKAMMEADAGAVATVFAPVRARHARPEEILTAVLAQMFTAFAEWWRGNPDVAVALANEMFGWIDLTENMTEGRPLDCFPFVVLARVHCAWNDLDAARSFADRALGRGRHGTMIGLFESSRALALVALAQNDWDTASRAAGDGFRAIRNIGNNALWTWEAGTLVHTVHFRRWQATGNRSDLDAVDAWVHTQRIVEALGNWDARRIAGFHCDAPLLLAVRVMIEKEQYDQALALLDDIRPQAERTQRLVAQIETLILRSILEARRGRPDDAIDAMRRALDLAARPRYIRPFADEGPAVLPILDRAAPLASDRDFATRVLASFGTPAPATPRSPSPETLSDRELEVLRLIASGASNQEAARKLFIAPSTVKKHLENIYAKLGVGGRVEAVGRGREMGVL
jgi:ATP/maltotriose-dependent transcriptional regulator MalT